MEAGPWRNVLAVAFTPAPASQSPNVRARARGDAQLTYYRAIVLTFASVHRWNPDVALVLVTDAPVPQPFAAQLKAGQVEVRQVTFDHRPPDGFYGLFNASLYTLDALRALDSEAPGTRTLLIDPDVLCTGSLDFAFAELVDNAVLAYNTGFPDTERSQGISAIEAVEIHRELNPRLASPPVHYGGELYGFVAGQLSQVLALAEDAYQLSLRRWREGKSYLVTEEHLLNYALRTADIRDAGDYVRRIWTAPVYRTVQGNETDLVLWHLPSEKDRAFASLIGPALDRSSWFWTCARGDWLNRAGSLLGIPRRRPTRWAYDTAGGQVRKLQAAVRRRRGQ